MAFEFLLLIIGAILLCVEMFIPGFGVFGISGVAMIVISAILTLLSGPLGAMIVLTELVVLAVIVYVALSYVKKRQLYGKIILSDVLDQPDTDSDDYMELIGRQGIVKTALRPVGTVEFNDMLLEAYAESGFIKKDQYVKVVRVDKRKIYVRPVN